MIARLKTYLCNRTPEDDDILQAMEIVKHDHCFVKILWSIPYSGTYYVIVSFDSTLEYVKEQIPKIYGI